MRKMLLVSTVCLVTLAGCATAQAGHDENVYVPSGTHLEVVPNVSAEPPVVVVQPPQTLFVLESPAALAERQRAAEEQALRDRMAVDRERVEALEAQGYAAEHQEVFQIQMQPLYGR